MSTVLPSAAHVPADAVNSYAVFRGTLSGAVTGIRVYAVFMNCVLTGS